MTRAEEILALLEKLPEPVKDRFVAELHGAALALDALGAQQAADK